MHNNPFKDNRREWEIKPIQKIHVNKKNNKQKIKTNLRNIKAAEDIDEDFSEE